MSFPVNTNTLQNNDPELEFDFALCHGDYSGICKYEYCRF